MSGPFGGSPGLINERSGERSERTHLLSGEKERGGPSSAPHGTSTPATAGAAADSTAAAAVAASRLSVWDLTETVLLELGIYTTPAESKKAAARIASVLKKRGGLEGDMTRAELLRVFQGNNEMLGVLRRDRIVGIDPALRPAPLRPAPPRPDALRRILHCDESRRSGCSNELPRPAWTCDSTDAAVNVEFLRGLLMKDVEAARLEPGESTLGVTQDMRARAHHWRRRERYFTTVSFVLLYSFHADRDCAAIDVTFGAGAEAVAQRYECALLASLDSTPLDNVMPHHRDGPGGGRYGAQEVCNLYAAIMLLE
eukprot:c17066_g1_i2.p1 GENE.c17066_g1_i2~~c17066_g1_i2.p1  ORF type:complete len:312 (-),score=12.11 c17066_g1_i2:779-1714(-)